MAEFSWAGVPPQQPAVPPPPAPQPYSPLGSRATAAPPAVAAAAAAAAVGAEDAAAPPSLPALPFALLQDVAALLAVDERLRMAAVSAGLRAALADSSHLWTGVVDLSRGSGVRRASDALLLAASARAGGALRALDVSGRLAADGGDPGAGTVSPAALVDVLLDNAAALRRVRALCADEPAPGEAVCSPLPLLVQVLSAAPRLATLEADVQCSAAECRAVLRNEPPFGALRVRRLYVARRFVDGEASVAALARDLSLHPSVRELVLLGAPLGGADGAALAAVVDAAVSARLTALSLCLCRLGPPSMPHLARLLRRASAAASLTLFNNDGHPAPPSPAFCAALRASRSLTRLALQNVSLWDGGAGVLLLGAVTGHPTVAHLDLRSNRAPAARRPAAGAALGRLVASDSLLSLDVRDCRLGDALRPLLAALPACARLRSLDAALNRFCAAAAGADGGRPSVAVALLAAVGANASLRALSADGAPHLPELQRAEALVAERGGLAA